MVQPGVAGGPRRWVVLVVAALCALALAAPAVAAPENPGGPPAQAETQGQRPSSEAIEELAAAARRDGSVRVMVELRTPFVPEGELSGGAAQAQRAAIARERAALARDLAGTGHRELHAFDTVPFVVLELPEQAVAALERSGRVASVVEDEPVPLALADSSPLVEAPQMWDAGYDGSGFTVAVLDTGVDTAHPFFGGRVVEEACYSTTNSRSTSLCRDGKQEDTGPGSGDHCGGIAGCEHGTHVAGIAGGHGAALSGVARGANLMSVQVFSRFDSGADCGSAATPCVLSWTSDQMKGLARVYELRNTHRFAAVNMSLGGGKHIDHCDERPMKTVIDNLRSVGIATVIATGNAGWTDAISAPACISSAIAVGSTTKTDEVSWFSNGHPTMVDLLAPGSSITSSIPGGGFQALNGTSMAAPHVAGAWALMRQCRPSASVATVLDRLQSSGLDVTDERGSTSFTHPRIQIHGAAMLSVPCAPAGLKAVAGNAEATITWNSPLLADGETPSLYTVTASPGGKTATVPASASQATVEGLTNGTAYTFRVRADAGPWSSPSNKVTPATLPGAPSGAKAVASDRQATVSWSAPASDGGSAITEYTVRASPGGRTAKVAGSIRKATVTGLTNGTAYRFTVEARNAVGTGPASSPSNQVTPATVPGAPGGVKAVAGNGQATVSWSAPASNGGSAITGYTVTASPDGKTVTVGGSQRSTTMTGLTNGTAYRFTVRATNAVGTGTASNPSSPVTPEAPPPDLPGFDGDPATTQRVNRGDATSAAIEVSRLRFPAGSGRAARHVVLSRDDAFPDSLAGASLTAEGPLLFTATASLTAATAAEIERVLAPGGTVYLLGGEQAISRGVESALASRGYQVSRLAGPTRVETALRVADRVRALYPSERSVAIARAFGAPDSPTSGWADSVTGGGYGASAGVPILVTPTSGVHPAVAAWLRADGPSRSILLGGTSALSNEVAAAVPNPQRVAGAERQETAALIATTLWRSPSSGERRFVVVNGRHAQGWAFGLAAGGLAADAGAPVLLVVPDIQPAPARLVGACGAPQVDLLLMGDGSVISEDLRAQLDALDGGAC